MADAGDYITLHGTTLLLKGPIAGKPVSELLSGLRIGRANYDDRQHAGYVVLDDFSGGFGYHNLDIREALGTHWDNPGGADLRRSRHITLPPKRYRLSADTNPVAMQFSAEILDGAAVAVPADSAAAGISSYLYLGAGDSVYRMNEARTTLTLVAQWVASGAAGQQINMMNSILPPTKMTRMFLYRSPSDLARRLYVITHDAAAAGPTSRYFFTSNPGASSPTWKQGPRFLWDALPITVGPGQRAILAQETQFRFMYSVDPLINYQDNAADTLTDWSINAATALDPTWIGNSVCRFLGESAAFWSSNIPAVYFLDYGDGRLYALDFHNNQAHHIPIGDYHYLLNGCIWGGFVAVTDGTDVWLYSAVGAETVRKIGIFEKDGVPNSFRDGRYRITGLLDGGRFLFAIAEYASANYIGFMVLVYNGTGWSLFSRPVEVLATSTIDTANPINAHVDRFPADVRVAATAQTPITRALNVLCQAKPANSKDVQLHSYALPRIGHIPIDGIDEFEGCEDAAEKAGDDNYDHEFITGWMDLGFRDIQGALYYMKIDMQQCLAGSRVDVSYRLNDDEDAAWTALGTPAAQGSTTMQFDQTGDANGIEFRTVQFKFNINRVNATILDGAIAGTGAVAIPVADASELPASGLIQIDSEIIEYASIATNTISATGQTRGAKGTTAATHLDDALVYSINRTPEMRAATICYNKKAPLRQTWVGEVDVNKMVEQSILVDTGGDGTPETAATHQNVYEFLKTIRDKQTLVKLVVPQAEPGTVRAIMVQLADFTAGMDDFRGNTTVRSTIPITLLEPVRADA